LGQATQGMPRPRLNSTRNAGGIWRLHTAAANASLCEELNIVG
jgi:hypothetical protein